MVEENVKAQLSKDIVCKVSLSLAYGSDAVSTGCSSPLTG